MTKRELYLWREALDYEHSKQLRNPWCPTSKGRWCGCELLEWSSEIDEWYGFLYLGIYSS